jgi:hypothetical protein
MIEISGAIYLRQVSVAGPGMQALNICYRGVTLDLV